MALPAPKLLVVKPIAQSLRDANDDLRLAIKSSRRMIEESREAIATANEILAQRVSDKSPKQ
jgi:hypothetical protein